MILTWLCCRIRVRAPIIAILNLRNAYLSLHVSLVAQEELSTDRLPRTLMTPWESFRRYYQAFGIIIKRLKLLLLSSSCVWFLYCLLMICWQWIIYALSVRGLIIHIHLRTRFDVPQDRGITLLHLILALTNLHFVSQLIQQFILLLEPKVKVPAWKALLNYFKDLYNINFEF